MQREKYEKVLGPLRQEYEDFKTQSKAKADEKQARFKEELQGLCDRKDAEIDAYREQSQVDLEHQKLKTKEAEEKCQGFEKQLSGGDAGKKDLVAKLRNVSDYQSVLVEHSQENSHVSQMELELSAANKAKDAAEKQLSELKAAAKEEAKKAREATQKKLQESNEARETTQSELDDLLMVFGDLEEKVAKYKASQETWCSYLHAIY